MDSPSPARHREPHDGLDHQPHPHFSWPVNSTARYRGSDADRLAIGDLHLWSLLTVHDALNRAGVSATFRVLTTRRLARALSACWYFELPALGELLARMPDAVGSPRGAEEFDAEYRRRYSNGAELIRAARHKLASAPGDFTVTRV
jgi:hypothetical protein